MKLFKVPFCSNKSFYRWPIPCQASKISQWGCQRWFPPTTGVHKGLYGALRSQETQGCHVRLCSVYTAKDCWPRHSWQLKSRPCSTPQDGLRHRAVPTQWYGCLFLCTKRSLLTSRVPTEQCAPTGSFKFIHPGGHLLHTGHIKACGHPAWVYFENNKCLLAHRIWLHNFESPVCW